MKKVRYLIYLWILLAIIAVVHISIEIIQIEQAGMAISFPWYTALYVPGIFYYIPLLILALILLICCIHKKNHPAH